MLVCSPPCIRAARTRGHRGGGLSSYVQFKLVLYKSIKRGLLRWLSQQFCCYNPRLCRLLTPLGQKKTSFASLGLQGAYVSCLHGENNVKGPLGDDTLQVAEQGESRERWGTSAPRRLLVGVPGGAEGSALAGSSATFSRTPGTYQGSEPWFSHPQKHS